jgi:putative transposase
MPRSARISAGGVVYHVVNRANGRMRLFRDDADFLAFYKVLRLAHDRHPIRILSWCIMPNHWHFVVWPRADGEISRFFAYLGLTHATRWQVSRNAVGTGHVYQGRFKNFMIQEDVHLQSVLRYVERNPLRAGLVKRAQDWPWSSLSARLRGPREMRDLLSDWPIAMPGNCTDVVNRAQTQAELDAIRTAGRRGRPLGDNAWLHAVVNRHKLQYTLRQRGRQKGSGKKRTER